MKHMKRYIFLILLIAGLNNACTDKLDVTPTYYQDIENALSTADGLQSLLNSSYAYARAVYGNYFYHFAEMLADTGEIKFVGTYEELQDLDNKSLVPTFSWGEFSWRFAYRAINGCNLILDNLDIVDDETTGKFLEGNARFIRGILYFDLTRFFALPYGSGAMSSPAVPLVTTGVKDPTGISYPEKATVQDVFNLVETDLRHASQLLGDDNVYANTYSAMAMLTRFYLTTEDYENAAVYADSVIESSVFSLMGDPFYAFNQSVNCSEDILTWQQSELDNEYDGGNAGMAAFYASTNAVGRSEMVITKNFITSTYGDGDVRGTIQLEVFNHNEVSAMYYDGFSQKSHDGEIYSSKWLDYNTNMTFCRLAEMYLTRAEANQMIIDGGGTEIGSNTPVNDINVILSRAGADTLTSPNVTIDQIRFERYRELIFEGHRLHDYKRWRRNVGNLPWDSESLIIPIPKKESDTNPNL
jgi:starch-binding outer membrane protein, SusD/RagB family